MTRKVLTVRVVLRLLGGVSGLTVRLGGLLLQLRQAPLGHAPVLLRLVVGALVARQQCVVVPQPPAIDASPQSALPFYPAVIAHT